MDLTPYPGLEHQAFLRFGAGRGSAVLIHGFPGTPREMRTLARLFHQLGWTVSGPLLPGFGPEISQLGEHRHREWLLEVERSRRSLPDPTGPVVLVGYSLGGALALLEAVRQPPAGVVLLAPFHRFLDGWVQPLVPVLQFLLPDHRPFAKMDLSSPASRQRISAAFPDLDPDDPESERFLRELTLPARALSELEAVGRSAFKAARKVRAPVLCLQGREDEVTPTARTRALLDRIPGPVELVEVPGGHELLDPDQPAWELVLESVERFARSLSG